MLRLRSVVLLVLLAGLPLAAAPAAPAPTQTGPAAERRAALDRMLNALKTTDSEQQSAALQTHIEQMWIQAGSPAATLLMGRGLRDLNSGAHEEAVEDFDSVLALEPDLAEAWHRRAMAKYALGDTLGAIRDLEETLRREPRHFSAFATLTRIAEQRQDWNGAYAAWQKMLEIAPKTPGGARKLEDLKRRALGQET